MFFLLAVFFLSGGSNDFPPESFQNIYRDLKQNQKEVLWQKFKELNLVDQDEELDYQFFHGAVNVIWRRSQGRPFPYPIDSSRGQRP